MKWYFAINENGTGDQVGVHAKLAVLSALKHTDLKPILLYYGARNAFIDWMVRHGVDVIDYEPPFTDYIKSLQSEGAYSMNFIGHWLRTGVCNIENEDEFVLYTDCDVLFTRQPDVAALHPATFACAPEFKVDNWNYFNSGVMVMNIAYLRRTYPDFEQYIRNAIRERGISVRDQFSYNMFYRGRWEHLDPHLNWKPYWGRDDDSSILHFHGPKIEAIFAILDGVWNWNDEPGRQIGSLFTGSVGSYRSALQEVLEVMGEELPETRRSIDRAMSQMTTFEPPAPPDLAFTSFRLFPD